MGVCLRVSKQEQISEQLNQSRCKQEVRRGYIIRRGGSLCWGCGRYVISSSLSKVYRSQEDFKKVLNIAKCTASLHQILGHFLLVFTVISGSSSNC